MSSKSLKRLLLQHTVTAIKGEELRKTFFNDQSLNFAEGYKILMGGVRRCIPIVGLPLIGALLGAEVG